MKQPALYILASARNGTLYIGVTSNLLQRVWQHKNNLAEGFTKEHGVHMLVYFELHSDMNEAITREKQFKRWKRSWKLELIEKSNPQWKDLWPLVVGDEGLDSRLRGNDSENECENNEKQ
jgi:putative endonuclease